MITTAFFNLAFFLASFLISIFPSGSGFPVAFHDAVSWLGGYLAILDPLVPIPVLFTCITLLVSVEIAIFGFKTFKWIFSHVPQIGGKGK